MNSELKKQMEIFIERAQYFAFLAARIRACRMTIEDSKLNKNLSFPPGAKYIRQIAKESVFPECFRYWENKDLSSEESLYLLETGPEKIQSLSNSKSGSFKIMEQFCICIFLMYMNYAESNDLKALYNDGKNYPVDLKEFKENLSSNPFVKMTFETDALGKQLETKFEKMEGYWIAKFERKKASQKGWEKKERGRQERLQKIKDMVEKEGTLEGSEYVVSRAKWDLEFENAFNDPHVSDKTKRNYRKELEKIFSSSYNKEITIILRK
jgi:hypothetical protein